MNPLIVYTDDICPSTIKKYWKFWSLLKSNYSNLKLDAFVVPHYFNNDDEFILNKDFLDWYESVKSWVTLHLHGYAHTYPPEGLLQIDEQAYLINRGIKILREITKTDFGFKPPGYYYNADTITVISKSGLPFMAKSLSEILFFNNIKQEIQVDLIQSHTNGLTNDSVEMIYNNLNESFKDREFLHTLELI